MTPEEQTAAEEIGRKFRLTTTPEKKGIGLKFDGIAEKFTLLWLNDEFILFTAAWHEHFGCVSEIAEFFGGLFSGTVQIVVKYRGKTPVGHQVQVIENGETQVVSRVGSLFPLFWRKKTFKRIEYRLSTTPPSPRTPVIWLPSATVGWPRKA